MKHNVTFTFLLCCLLCCNSIIAFAHTGSLKGNVYDGQGKKPLEGASIYVKNTDRGTATDALGHFFIKGLHEGKYSITVSLVGFETITREVKIEDGITTELSFNMLSTAVKMSEVAISAKRDLELGTLSGLDLKQRPANNTQDLMRLVPGLFTSQHQGGGKAEQVFLRGFDCDHGTDVNVSVDGMPVNMISHAHGQGYADSHFIIPELIDELNFGKGPYRIDKGNLTTAGWVDFKTKDYLDKSFLKLEAGNYGYFRTAGGLDLLDRNTGEGRHTAYIAGEYGFNRSYFDRSQNFNRFNLSGKYTNYISDKKKLSITLSGFHTYWNASGQIPERAVSEGIIDRFGELDGEGGSTSRYTMNIQYFQSLSNNSYFKGNVYGGYYDFSLYSDFTYFLEDTVNGDEIHQAEQRVFGGYNAAYNTRYNIGRMRTKTEVGIGMRYDNIQNSELSHTVNENILLKRIAYGDISESNLYAYLNETIDLLPGLVINGGTRFDYFLQDYHDKMPAAERRDYNYTNSTFSPKAGIHYNIRDNARIYYNYGIGFHSNDTRTLATSVQQGEMGVTGHVLPLASSMDLGIIIKPYPKLLLSFALWQLDLQQEFTYSGDGGVVEPSGRTRRRGVDLSLRYEILKWLYADADANHAHARYRDEPQGENYVPLAAAFTSIGGLTFKIHKDLNAGLRYRYMADRPAIEDNSLVAQGYTVCDAVINYIRPRYELGVQVQNLLNTEWREAQFATETRLRNEVAQGIPPQTDICYTPGTPFFIKFTATYKF